MRSPSSVLRNQAVTVFKPAKATEPVNGGYATTYTKTVYYNLRYTITTDKKLHVTLYDVSNTVDYDSLFAEALIVPGVYPGLTPPKEGTEKHFYAVSSIHHRWADGHLHNIGIDAV